jgi:SNF2 family DNA or RNA helicase
MILPLLPYQVDGATWMAPRARCGLFDEPGAGKTAQLVRLADTRQAMRIVVVCPAIARENWRGEFKKFSRTFRKIVKASNIHDFRAWQRGAFDVLLCSYEMAVKWAPLFDETGEPIDLLVFDEAHYMKNHEAKRTRALLGRYADGVGGVLQWARCAVWATGTPIPNDPQDIWTFLRMAQAMPLHINTFKDRYFVGRAGTYSMRHEPKPEMLAELRTLIENNSIRRRLVDVGVQLPPIFLTTSLVEGDTSAIRELLLSHPGLDAKIIEALNLAREEDFSLASVMRAVDVEHVAVLRRLIGEAKALPYAANLVHELNSGLDKMVVFGVHKSAAHILIAYLNQHGMQPVLVNGDTPEAHRQAYMRAFQEDPKCRVLVGNIRAAGVALTLTASAAIDMLESDWSPAANWQALKRVHRLTQTRSVRARFITLADSFDEVVNDVVAEKTKRIGLIEGQAMTAAPPK